MFEWQPKSTVDLTYIKIFVTKDHTSFSFLTQYGLAIEDTLRGLTRLLKRICHMNNTILQKSASPRGLQ